MKNSTYLLDNLSLKQEFFNIKKVLSFWFCLNIKLIKCKTYDRIWSYNILVEKKYLNDTLKYWLYNREISLEYDNILKNMTKNFFWKEYILLVNHKCDKSREVISYLIKNNINTEILILDNDPFWFFHDMWHLYLADIVDNFYENVYWYPEQLNNIFSIIKLKQYWYFDINKSYKEITEKSKYPKLCKEIFYNLYLELINLNKFIDIWKNWKQYF